MSRDSSITVYNESSQSVFSTCSQRAATLLIPLLLRVTFPEQHRETERQSGCGSNKLTAVNITSATGTSYLRYPVLVVSDRQADRQTGQGQTGQGWSGCTDMFPLPSRPEPSRANASAHHNTRRANQRLTASSATKPAAEPGKNNRGLTSASPSSRPLRLHTTSPWTRRIVNAAAIASLYRRSSFWTRALATIFSSTPGDGERVPGAF